MAARTFDVGDRPTFTATFRDNSDALTDPATVTFLWRTATGVETSYAYNVATEVARSSLGVYTFTPPTIAASGKHVCRVRSTSVTTAGELAIEVRRTAFAAP